MKKILPWVKSNLLVVIALVVSLIAVPVMIFFSAGMNKKLRDRLNNDVAAVTRDLTGITVTYEIPSLEPGGQPLSVRAVPNDATTEVVSKHLGVLAALSRQALDQVIERNSAGKTPIVSGLFPAPADESARIRLTAEMVRAWPEAHRTLLANAHAGTPPDAGAVLRLLEQRERREIDEIERNRAEKVTPEEMEVIRTTLITTRREAYRNAAKAASFYADPSVFTKLSEVPAADNLPRIDEYQRLFWDWQHAFWVHQDIVSAIVRANDSPRGWLPIIDAPVKRLVSVTLEPLTYAKPSGADLTQALERDFKVSPSGRKGGNALYDTRRATVELIVDAASINTVIDAFATTNFMGVRSVTAVWHEGTSDLAAGFDYGDHSVAKLTLELDTLWIRSWIDPFMPPDVKASMGDGGAATGGDESTDYGGRDER